MPKWTPARRKAHGEAIKQARTNKRVIPYRPSTITWLSDSLSEERFRQSKIDWLCKNGGELICGYFRDLLSNISEDMWFEILRGTRQMVRAIKAWPSNRVREFCTLPPVEWQPEVSEMEFKIYCRDVLAALGIISKESRCHSKE